MMGRELTSIELQTLRLMLAGKTLTDIATEHQVTFQAVHVRTMKIRRKTGLRTMVQLGAWAERHGIREAGVA